MAYVGILHEFNTARHITHMKGVGFKKSHSMGCVTKWSPCGWHSVTHSRLHPQL